MSRVHRLGGLGVDIKLAHRATTPSVFWSTPWERPAPHGGMGGCNSYVVANTSRDGTEGPFIVDAQCVNLYSINGIGEIRWEVTKQDLINALRLEAEGITDPSEGTCIEMLAAARHFGILPKSFYDGRPTGIRA